MFGIAYCIIQYVCMCLRVGKLVCFVSQLCRACAMQQIVECGGEWILPAH